MTAVVRGGVVILLASMMAVMGWSSGPASAAVGLVPSSSDDSQRETIWQIGIFDGLKHEFGFDFLDTDFVCDDLPDGSAGVKASFVVGETPTYSFPTTIMSSNAPTDDERYEHACNSVTIEFETAARYEYEDVKLVYSRMGGEADVLVVDGKMIGITGELTEDPHPSKEYVFNLEDIGPGEHTIRILGLQRTPCSVGDTCRSGLADGYHFVDALRLSGEKRKVDDEPGEAAIDIKPGNRYNVINPRSQGKIMVAVLSSSGFDAADVDAESARFGPDRARRAHNQVVFQDVDHDGDDDMVLHFETDETGIECGDTEATLEGKTEAGDKFSASDSVLTVGCNGRGRGGDRDDDDDDEDRSDSYSSHPVNYQVWPNVPGANDHGSGNSMNSGNGDDRNGNARYEDDDDDDDHGRGRGRGRGQGRGRGNSNGHDKD